MPGQSSSALYGRAGGSLGAVATFIGLVRDQFEGARVSTLHLEHYPGYDGEEYRGHHQPGACERWPLLRTCWWCTGSARSMPARRSSMCRWASGHRDAAFAAAEFIMDYLKTEAVFWKRETAEGAARWVESTA